MFKLVLDTALDYYYLALIKDNEIINEEYEKGAQNHSETLLPRLEAIVKENGISTKDIEEIYVGIGPGSYTGVRIAVVIAKMLGVMNNARVYKFSTLALLASSKTEESYPFIDCRRGNAYLSHFTYENGILTRKEEDKVESINEFFKDKDESKALKEGKPNPFILLNSKEVELVEDINSLSPNYLQMVEAERIKKGLQ